jgi:capsular exopolysaccharide synthesis family protein
VSKSNQDKSDALGVMSTRQGAGEVRIGSSGEISLTDLIRVFRRRKWIFPITAVTFLLVGTLYCALKTPLYEAEADLAINPEGSNSLDMGDITASLGGGGLGFDEKLETQVHVLNSKSLAWTVISDLRLDRQISFAGHRKYSVFGPRIIDSSPDQIERTSPARRNQLLRLFGQSLTVQTIARTQAVKISFRNADPVLARDIVNHLVSSYIQRSFMTRYDDTMKASEWLSGQLDQLRSDVGKSESKLSQFQKQTGIVGTDENNNLVLSKLDDLSKELTDAEADRIAKEAQYRIAQTGNPELIGTLVPDSVLPILRGQEANLKTQLAQTTTEFGPRYPVVIQLKEQLAQVDKSLKKEIVDIQERFHTAYQISAGTEKQMQEAFDQQKQLAYGMADGLDQYGILKREVESGHDLYEDLLKKLKESGVVASLKAITVDPIDLAILSTNPVEPRVPLVLTLCLIFGLGTGVGLAFLAESLDSQIRSMEEFESLVSIPLFAVIPHFPIERKKQTKEGEREEAEESKGVSIIALQRPNSQVAEAFRALRTALQLVSAGTPPKSILITSAIPGEGKSTVGVNLAAVFSQGGKRVLLIDADLRRGILGARINVPKNFGLSGALTGTGSWRNAVVAVPTMPSLSFLQAGFSPPNPADLVGSAQMQALLKECAEEFDYVIIDSPPVLLVTDSVLIAQWVDVVLYVARIGITPRAALRRTTELLRTGRDTASGMVVNDINLVDQYYGYGYGYGRSGYSKSGYYSDEEV